MAEPLGGATRVVFITGDVITVPAVPSLIRAAARERGCP